MAETWTTEAVLALAPTANAAAAARRLTSGALHDTGRSERALWGWCKGSGANPYLVMADLEGPAWRCTCPSRRTPCKHVLALLLLHAEQPDRVPADTPPEAVAEWLADRDRRAQRAAARKDRGDRGPADPEAQAKRAAERHARISGGLADLDRWLGDLVRQGLAGARQQPYSFWDGIAARMVDAQAPAVAERLRSIPERVSGAEDWPQRLLTALGELHLIAQGWARLESLPPALQADLRTAVGWPLTAEEVAAAGERLGDTWVVVGQSQELTGRVRTYRTWLLGVRCGRFALLLGFTPVAPDGSVMGAVPEHAAWPSGRAIDAELAFYPGSVPLRARVAAQHRVVDDTELLPAWGTVADALADHAAAVAANPWLGVYPLLLAAVVPVQRGDEWLLRDAEGTAVPLRNGEDTGWRLLDRFGGHPAGVFGERSRAGLTALSWMDASEVTRRPAPRQPRVTPVARAATAGVTAAWPRLTGPALAGTERRPVGQLLTGDGRLTAVLAQRAPEPALLGSAAAAAVAARVGEPPPTTTGRLPDPAPEDPRPGWGEPVTRWLEWLVGGDGLAENGLEPLVPWWARAAAQAGLRAPDGTTRTLIQHGSRRGPHRGAVLPALGERGRWLARRHPAGRWVELWGTADVDVLEQVWQRGRQPERQLALERLREVAPDRGRELLAVAWPTLRIEQVRRALLGCLAEGLSYADEPLLETALDDRSAAVATRARGLLARLPHSALRARMTNRSHRLVRWEQNRGQLTVNLEAAAAFHADDAAVRDQVAPNRPEFLQDLVAATPLHTWTEMTGRTPEQLLEAAWRGGGHPHLSMQLIFGWAEAARQQPDPAWVRALLADAAAAGRREVWSVAGAIARAVASGLDDSARIAVITEHLRGNPFDEPAVHLVLLLERPLPAEPSRQVLAGLAAGIDRSLLGGFPVERLRPRPRDLHRLHALAARLDPRLLHEAGGRLGPLAERSRGHALAVAALTETMARHRDALADLPAAAP